MSDREKKIFARWNMWKNGVATKTLLLEDSITLHTDPDYYGADVEGEFSNLPVNNIELKHLTGFEPDEKMQQPDAIKHVNKLLRKLNTHVDLPPILVRTHKGGYQVLDGHHRFQAYKLANRIKIPAKIVPDENITVN